MRVSQGVRRFCAAMSCLIVLQVLLFLLEERRRGVEARVSTELVSLGQISTGLRRGLANVIWIRIDDYLHTSTQVRPRQADAYDPEETSWGHSAQASARELIPLMRLVVLLDPSFVQAGALLTAHLLKQGKKLESRRLIQDLVAVNHDHPRLYQVYEVVGRSMFQAEDYEAAASYLVRAAQLFARVEDAAALEKAGEPPLDSGDRLLQLSILGSLVESLARRGDYEAAFLWWARTPGFAPDNIITRILAEYGRMKQQGNVDREALARRFVELEAEVNQRYVGDRRLPGFDPSAGIADENLVLRDRGGDTKQPPDLYVPGEVAQKVIFLTPPPALLMKLGLLAGLSLLLVTLGRYRGWLAR